MPAHPSTVSKPNSLHVDARANSEAFGSNAPNLTVFTSLLLHFFPSLFHSYLSATVGSRLDALRAGTKQDKPAVATSTKITPARISTLSEPP